MQKYMLTIQHSEQKVAYIEFQSENDSEALTQGEFLYKQYKLTPSFTPKIPYISGNFSGYKPAIKSQHVSKWINSSTAVNAWGANSGGYWSTLANI